MEHGRVSKLPDVARTMGVIASSDVVSLESKYGY